MIVRRSWVFSMLNSEIHGNAEIAKRKTEKYKKRGFLCFLRDLGALCVSKSSL